MSRIVAGLTGAWPIERPGFMASDKAARGARAKGLRFERLVASAAARQFPRTVHGQWFNFEDANGPGHCQPDVMIPTPGGGIFILECKLTDNQEALDQIRYLYVPVVRKATGRHVQGAIVARNLTRQSRLSNVVTGLRMAMDFAQRQPSEVPIIHWLGGGDI